MSNALKKEGRDKRDLSRPRKRLRKPEPKQEPQRGALREALSVMLVVLGVFLLTALVSHYRELGATPLGTIPDYMNTMGRVGRGVAYVLVRLLGLCSFVSVIWAFLLARSVWAGRFGSSFGVFFATTFGSFFLTISCAEIAAVFSGTAGGGALGVAFARLFLPYVNEAGAVLAGISLTLLSLGIATGLTPGDVVEFLGLSARGMQKGLNGSLRVSKKVGFVTAKANIGAMKLAARASKRMLERGRNLSAVASNPKLLPLVIDKDFHWGGAGSNHVETVLVAPSVTLDKPSVAIEEPEEENDEGDAEAALPQKPAKKARFSLGKTIIRKQLERSAGKVSKRRRAERSLLPPLDLLVRSDTKISSHPKDEELIRNCHQLERTLADFRINGKVVEVQPGPVITLYQFEPGAGIKVNRIVNLADDLALALKVASVRVYAPVPGKGTVGIEVPNANREVVRLRDILAGEKFLQGDSPLTLALGKDTFGDPYVADLSKMPHLLIAGATGTGKSVCINSLLLSLLYRNAPEDLRLILIDPKMLELSIYEEIPHLKAPVVTNPKRARGVLWWAVEEMERRYRLMMELGVRSLEGYNKAVQSGQTPLRSKPAPNKVIELDERDVVATGGAEEGLSREDKAEGEDLSGGGEPLPRIVIVVDELADLMLTVGREIEELLTRLAQKARAAGIHLILATQRPSVNVITGLIKANFPSRISFKVASRIDARTVLDSSGAEKLLGQGDMLFVTAGAGRPKRVHSAFVSDKEVHDVTNWLREQGAPDYDAKIEQMVAKLDEVEAQGGDFGGELEEFDPLYDQAVNLVVEKGQASTSMVQRVFRIGYNRAARMLEMMEREGVVGPADGAKPRSILVPHREA